MDHVIIDLFRNPRHSRESPQKNPSRFRIF